jgi:energy-coupling factor transporter ATP-binding protein EcfA2
MNESTTSQEPLYIVRLEVDNVKGIRAIRIKPDGSVVHITGKNGAGKSSVLDAIEYALAGTRSQPPKPLREGARHAQVVVDAGEFTITRRWAASGKSTLNIERKNGAPIRRPQEFLDNLVGPIAFDPGRFLAMSPRDQAEELRKAVGLDFSKLDETEAALREQRRACGQEKKRLEGVFATLPEPPKGIPDKPIDVAALTVEFNQAHAQRAENDKLRSDIEYRNNHIADLQRRIEALQRDMADEAEELNMLTERAKQIVDPDIASMETKLRDAETINEQVRTAQQRVAVRNDLGKATDEYDEYTRAIEQAGEDRHRMLADAQWPVEGLGFDESGGVTFNGHPFEQASSAEQLRTAIGLGLAADHRFRVLLMREGGHFDADSLAMVQALAEASGVQVWLETPSDGDGPPGAIVIEDGSVKDEGVD